MSFISNFKGTAINEYSITAVTVLLLSEAQNKSVPSLRMVIIITVI